MVRGGVAGLRSRVMLSPCLCTIDCGMPPQGSLYISTEAWRSFRCKVCRAPEWKHREGVGSLHDPAEEFYQWKEGCRRGGACYTNCLRSQSWALLVWSWSRQGTALSQLPHASALSSLEPSSCSSAMEGKMYCCPHGESTFVLFYILCFCSVSPSDLRRLGARKNFFPN